MNDFDSGFSELAEALKEYENKSEHILDALKAGAEALVEDLLKLPKPRSKITKPTYTHIIDTFSYRVHENKEIEVGWGKYYGHMLERGTVAMLPKPHIKPTWESNRERYMQTMIKALGL